MIRLRRSPNCEGICFVWSRIGVVTEVLYRCVYNNSIMYRLYTHIHMSRERARFAYNRMKWKRVQVKRAANEQTNHSSFNEFTNDVVQLIPYRRTAARVYQCIARWIQATHKYPIHVHPVYSFVSASFSSHCWLCFCYLNAAQIHIKLLAHWVPRVWTRYGSECFIFLILFFLVIRRHHLSLTS